MGYLKPVMYNEFCKLEETRKLNKELLKLTLKNYLSEGL